MSFCKSSIGFGHRKLSLQSYDLGNEKYANVVLVDNNTRMLELKMWKYRETSERKGDPKLASGVVMDKALFSKLLSAVTTVVEEWFENQEANVGDLGKKQFTHQLCADPLVSLTCSYITFKTARDDVVRPPSRTMNIQLYGICEEDKSPFKTSGTISLNSSNVQSLLGVQDEIMEKLNGKSGLHDAKLPAKSGATTAKGKRKALGEPIVNSDSDEEKQ